MLFLSILTQDKGNVEYRRGSVGPDRLPLVPVVSILSYSMEYEIGILSLLDKESRLDDKLCISWIAFLHFSFNLVFMVTRMIFHLNPHTFNLNSFPPAEGTSLPVHFSTTGSSINGSPLEHRHGVWIVFMQRTKLHLIFTKLQNFS